jgi:hypothetical protein
VSRYTSPVSFLLVLEKSGKEWHVNNQSLSNGKCSLRTSITDINSETVGGAVVDDDNVIRRVKFAQCFRYIWVAVVNRFPISK